MYVTASIDLNLICVDCGRMLYFIQVQSPDTTRTILRVETCPCAGKSGARPRPTINETLGEIATTLDRAGVDVQKLSTYTACENCGKPCTGYTADDVPLCEACAKALMAQEQAGGPGTPMRCSLCAGGGTVAERYYVGRCPACDGSGVYPPAKRDGTITA